MVKNKKRHTSQIGTKIYMAPEMKNSNYSLPVDIYSLGLVDILLPWNIPWEGPSQGIVPINVLRMKVWALGLELPYRFNLHYKSYL